MAGLFYLLRALVKHLASAWKLVRVRRLSSQGGGVRRPCSRLLSGGRFGHVVGQAGAAGAGHGRRAAGGTENKPALRDSASFLYPSQTGGNRK